LPLFFVLALVSIAPAVGANGQTAVSSALAGDNSAGLADAARSFDEGEKALGSGEYALAKTCFEEAYRIRLRLLGPADEKTLLAENDLAAAHLYLGDNTTAESLYREIYETETREHRPGIAILAALGNLAAAIQNQGPARAHDAAVMDRQVYEARLAEKGPNDRLTLKALNNLAMATLDAGQPLEAENLLRPLFQSRLQANGFEDADTLMTLSRLARVLQAQHRFGDAADAYRSACSRLSDLALASGRTQQNSRLEPIAASCNAGLALDLRDLSDSTGGIDPALESEAFLAAQRAIRSTAGAALSRESARAFAAGQNVGALADEYEQALDAKESLEQRWTAEQSGEANRSADLSDGEARLNASISALAARLSAAAPRYWDYRSPQPLDIAALQAQSDSALLRDDEAVILCLMPADSGRGLVFAVSRQRSGWAVVPAGARQLESDAQALRSAIASARAGSALFDTAVANRLYRELLGSTAIQTVIADKPVLLFALAAPFAELPPSLLVVTPPARAASDAKSLRDTDWLIKRKAVAVLPSVSSLVVLRRHATQPAGQASVPLVAFADPDFRGTNGAAARMSSAAVDAWFRALPALPGARSEASALQSILNASPDDILVGAGASKTGLDALVRSGTIANASVIEFATHGFPPGTIPGVQDAALALAYPSAGADESDDGLLKASDIAGLKLHADWVLLSACDSAAASTQILSGLPEAFFYAGARSILVSHWRVRDDAATRLVVGMFQARRNDPAIGKAEALRQSMLQLMNDTSFDSTRATLADPAAWGAFTIIGDER